MAENFAGITDTGRVRENNEDTFIAERIQNNSFILACVIDGVGGYAYGEVAAAVARDTILDCFSHPSEDIAPMLKASFIAANDRIFSEKRGDSNYERMACVLTLAVVDTENNQFMYAHLGDTRLYLLRDDSLIKVTKDHSFVGLLEDSGRLSEEAAMRHPKRNEIDKALGFYEQIDTPDDYIETGHSPFLPDDILLLCSDGLSDLLPKNEITSILRGSGSLAEKGAALVAAANEKGGRDNITVVLVHHDKAPLKTEAVRSALSQKDDDRKEWAHPHPQTDSAAPPAEREPNRRQPLVAGLSLGCFVFLATSLWLFRQNRANEQEAKSSSEAASLTQTVEGQQLQTLVNTLTGDTLFLSDSAFARPIQLGEALLVERDSLYIKTQGNVVLTRAGTYAGPAISLAQSNGHLVVDGLSFEGFQVAISMHSQALALKNVTFRQCLVPVQRTLSLPDNQPVNARLTVDSLVLNSHLP